LEHKQSCFKLVDTGNAWELIAADGAVGNSSDFGWTAEEDPGWSILHTTLTTHSNILANN
jgi:hypothetical protein